MRDFRQILIAVVLAVFVAEFIWYLACQCVRYIRLQTRIHSRVSVFIAVGFCLVGMYVSGKKPGTNDVDGADVIYGLMTAYVPSTIGGLTDGYDIYTVTNLYFDSFDKSGTVVRVGISIGEDSIEYGESIRIFAADSLDRPNWTNIYEHEVGYEDSLIAQFDMSLFPTSYLQQAYFGLDFPQDSDGDGVGDGDERYVYHSNPLKYDSDDDGLGDGDEIRLGSNPVLLDTDGDGLTDAEEAGGSLVLADSSFLWLDTSTCAELPLGSGGSYKDWDVMVPGGVSLAGVNYTSCNMSLYGRLSFGQDGVTIDACGQWMYAYPSWSSGVYYGTVATNGVEYFVVEYRNISSDSAGDFKLTCQVLVPLAERNVVYVSYLQVDDGLDDPVLPLGIGCENMVSPFSSIESYSILPPVGHSSPVSGTTIKYIIGFGSDPSEYNRYYEPDLPVGSNSNAYFTVDVVASECAHIVFAGSGVSTLPDPDFFAMPNETNRVRLLIGKSYDVTSGVPIVCAGASAPDTIITNSSDVVSTSSAEAGNGMSYAFTIVRPVEILPSSCDGGFRMNISPFDLGGLFYWTNTCCTVSDINGVYSALCHGCGCHGCTARGYYRYEGYDVECAGIPCGCNPIPDVGEPSCEIDIPDTLFVNNDDDDNDGIVDFGHNYDASVEDDLVPVVVNLHNPTTVGGSVTMTISGSFAGSVVEDNPSHATIIGSKTWSVSPGEPFVHSVLLDPSAPSTSYQDCWVTVSWELENGCSGSLIKSFTVVEPVIEPICNETKSVIIDDKVHHLAYNPCGVGIGKDAYFKIRGLQNSYPDSKIIWSVADDSVGVVVFPRGRTGREVRVRGYSEGKVTLNVQIGESRSSIPSFTLHVVTNTIVNVRAVIVGDSSGSYACTSNEVVKMFKDVNDIYAQANYEFNVVSIIRTNILVASSVELSSGGVGNVWNCSQLFDLMRDTNGIECYFIERFIRNGRPCGITGVHTHCGLAVSSRGNSKTLAHEIGHAFGWKDIYARKGELDMGARLIRAADFAEDWNGGCNGFGSGGVRYYEEGMLSTNLVQRLLMYGRNNEAKRDIPNGDVYGVKNSIVPFGQVDAGMVFVGCFDGFSNINSSLRHD